MSTKTARQAWLISLLLIIAMALSGTAHAGTTGQLSGFVVDEESNPLPGVSVSASSPTQIGGVLSTQTDGQGWFQFPRLNPGYFSVTLELDGVVTQELTEVQVRLTRMTRVHVTMPLAVIPDEITVTETTPVVDPQRVSTGQTFTDDYIEAAAVGMNVRYAPSQIVLQAAGATSTYPGGESGPSWGISVLGSTASESVFLVDGLDTSDPYQGGPSAMITLDSIQEVAFESGGFGAEYGRATGGVINSLTKSGSNTLAGTFDARYSDNSLETSGDHYDPDEQTSSSRILTATLGGRFVRDRAWYFASLESQRYEWTPTGAPTTGEESWDRGFLKVTGQVSPSWLAVGKFHKSPWELLNMFSDQFMAPEATARFETDETLLQAEVSGVLSPNLLWEIRGGSFSVDEDFGPMSGDSSPISHYNFDTGVTTGNQLQMFSRKFGRDQLGTSLAWFVDDALGSHEIKLGGEYLQTSFDQEHCWTGLAGGGFCSTGGQGFRFLDLADAKGNAIPFVMTTFTSSGPNKVGGTLPSLFIQDAWRVRPNVSLKLGLRWDRSTFDNDAGEEVANLELLQPRAGITWDLTRDGRSLLRASWGRFMNSSFLRLPRLARASDDIWEDWDSCSYGGLPDPDFCRAVADSEGWEWRSDHEGWDPAGWLLWERSGSEPTRVAPNLKPSYSDTLIVGFERELLRRTSLELSYVDKATRDIFEDTCIENSPTPTPDAGCSGFIIANIPAARRDYTAWILNFESRAVDRLHVLASYTNSDAKGSIGTGSIATDAFDRYPYHFVNRYGYLSYHRKHRVKINGYVFLPLDFGLGFSGVWGSPFVWTPLQPARLIVPGVGGNIFVEPRGSREGDEWAQLDVQATKAFNLGRVRLQLIGAVLNLFDAENATAVCERVIGCGDFETGDPIEWQIPRRYELGVRVEF